MANKNQKSQEAQEMPKQRTCGTMQVHERLLRTNPDYLRARVFSENKHHEYLLRGPMMAREGVTVIPVVVHVVYQTQQQNISDAQIQSQITVLNHDYRMTNADISTIPAAFQTFAGDSRIEFVLASTDPSGQPTNGIIRKQTNVAGFSDDDKVKSAATGGDDAWPADKYLNIWVCQLGGGLLGYAQFPGGPASTDGVVILHSAFGTSGTAAAPFNLGRSATHEIGHWLNLRHIWGDDGNGCNGSDFVDDTPNQGGPNYGTPSFPHVTCNNGPNGDMYMNYMDYVDDAAMVMFSDGQILRMQACLDGDRSTIGTIKSEPTIKYKDEPTIAIRDIIQTIKFKDEPTTPYRDIIPTIKFKDDIQTIKKLDDIQTLKFREDVKTPALDKMPSSDGVKFLTDNEPVGPQQPYSRSAAPFVLSTPHHSMAWMKTFSQSFQATLDSYTQQLAQYEEALEAYARADEAGQLSNEDYRQAEMLYNEYINLMNEYRSLMNR
jgi:hypothetical protein